MCLYWSVSKWKCDAYFITWFLLRTSEGGHDPLERCWKKMAKMRCSYYMLSTSKSHTINLTMVR